MNYSPFDMFKLEECGMFDTDSEHEKKVKQSKKDLRALYDKGYNPNFYVDEVLHYNGLSLNSISNREYENILDLSENFWYN